MAFMEVEVSFSLVFQSLKIETQAKNINQNKLLNKSSNEV